MVIHPTAVKTFIARKTKSSNGIKTGSLEKLRRKVAKRCDPYPDFVLPPYLHQLASFLLALKYSCYFFIVDMGLGKTKIMLDLLRYRMRCQPSRMLVLVPAVSTVGAWEDEIDIHLPEIKTACLTDKIVGAARETAVIDDRNKVVVITYNGWLRLVKDPKVGKGAWKPSPARTALLLRTFDHVVLDESDAIKNHRSKFWTMCRQMMRHVRYRYCLTGTPLHGQHAEDLWSQFYFCDGGETLGETLGLFRAGYMTEHKMPWLGPRASEWKINRKNEKLLNARMPHGSVRYDEKDCIDLPAKVGGIERPNVIPVELPRIVWAHYSKMLAQFKQSRGDRGSQENVYHRMRMLAGGVVVFNTNTGDIKKTPITPNVKLDALMQLIESLAPHKVAVYHHHVLLGELIAARLAKAQIKYLWLHGKAKNKPDIARAFVNPKHAARVLIFNSAGAKGLNLQTCCSRMVFFESPDDIATRRQVEKRIRRPGQTQKTFYWDILARGTVDERIVKSLQQGGRFFDRLLDGSEKI